MSADRGQLRTMRLLPFTAAADEAAWVADLGTIVGRAMKERSLPLPGGCWKLRSIRLHQAREAPVEDYDGRQVVGMDLHRRRSVLVRMTEDGRRLGMARITN